MNPVKIIGVLEHKPYHLQDPYFKELSLVS